MLDLGDPWRANAAALRFGAVSNLVSAGRDPMPPAGGCDTVLATTALCAADDPVARAGEAWQWLRPGGELLVLEHTRGVGLVGLAQRAAAPGASQLRSCHLDVDVPALLRRTGFEVTDLARFRVHVGGVVPVPCVAVVARRPQVAA